MYISKVEISNIRSIEKFEMTFSKPAGWHVIIGDNGAGKTTVLRAIALGLIGSDQAAALRTDWIRWIKNGMNDGKIKIEIGDKNINPDLGFFSKLYERQIHTIRIFQLLLSPSRERLRILSSLQNDPNSIVQELSIYPSPWFSSGFGPFRRFTGGSGEWGDVYGNGHLVEFSRHLSLFDESVALTETTEWLMRLKFQKLENKENNYDSILELINSDDFLPSGTKLTDVSSSGITFQDGNRQSISIYELSDGFRSILSLTLELLRHISGYYESDKIFHTSTGKYIYVNVPGLVLIDEIDAHLHPTWQTRIGHWFTKYFPNIQFIVTTHSPLVCRACEHGSIWRLAAPGSDVPSGEITGTEKDKLVFGNILDAYGTEVFGKSAVRSEQSDEKLERLGKLNMLFALNKITESEEIERVELQKILSTDDPTGF